MPEGKGQEPQSYGSQAEWVEGDTGQTVNDTDRKTAREQESFYGAHAENEISEVSQPPSPEVLEDSTNTLQAARPGSAPVVGAALKKVSMALENSRQSYFKNRDYPDSD